MGYNESVVYFYLLLIDEDRRKCWYFNFRNLVIDLFCFFIRGKFGWNKFG